MYGTKVRDFPGFDYLEAFSTATATATVAPTMGLLPIPTSPTLFAGLCKSMMFITLCFYRVGAFMFQPYFFSDGVQKCRFIRNDLLSPFCPHSYRDRRFRYTTLWYSTKVVIYCQ